MESQTPVTCVPLPSGYSTALGFTCVFFQRHLCWSVDQPVPTIAFILEPLSPRSPVSAPCFFAPTPPISGLIPLFQWRLVPAAYWGKLQGRKIFRSLHIWSFMIMLILNRFFWLNIELEVCSGVLEPLQNYKRILTLSLSPCAIVVQSDAALILGLLITFFFFFPSRNVNIFFLSPELWNSMVLIFFIR